jgi:hypothetical protein
MKRLLGKDFVAHTISSEDAGGGLPCGANMDPGNCNLLGIDLGIQVVGICGAAAPGLTYYKLADLTKGIKLSICLADWTQVFGPLTKAVIKSAPLPCNYVIPPPPGQRALDPQKVNVTYFPPAGAAKQALPKAESLTGCGENRAWAYDKQNNPKEVLLCPKTCDLVAVGGTISISFGCETILLK